MSERYDNDRQVKPNGKQSKIIPSPRRIRY